jgi:hypothetical protein
MRTLWQLGNSEKTPRNSSSATVIRGAIKCKTRDGRVDDKVLWSSFPIVHSINAPPLRNSRGWGGGIRTRQLRMLILACSLRVSAAMFIIIISSVGSCLQGERHTQKKKKLKSLGHCLCWSEKKKTRSWLQRLQERVQRLVVHRSSFHFLLSTLSSMRLYGPAGEWASLSARPRAHKEEETRV